MRFAFVTAEKASWPVEVLCETLKVSRSGYYAWSKRRTPARTKADAALKAQITAVHAKSRSTYGSPRVHAELRSKGLSVSRKRVERLMREEGIKARQKRRFRRTTDSNHTHPIAPNVLEREFTAEAPNKVWVTDVTYIATDEGWLYLAAILDLFSRRVIGWATSATNDRLLALDALDRALRARKPRPGLLHHSDRGSPYASEDYREALRRRGLVVLQDRDPGLQRRVVVVVRSAHEPRECRTGDTEFATSATGRAWISWPRLPVSRAWRLWPLRRFFQ